MQEPGIKALLLNQHGKLRIERLSVQPVLRGVLLGKRK
jgi:hypothetical protein